MITAVNNFIGHLKENEWHYTYRTLSNDVENIGITLKGEHIQAVTVEFFFDKKGKDVNISSYSIARVPKEKINKMLEKINALNRKYRWINFYIDDDNDISASYDAIVNDDTAAEICMEHFYYFYNIIDEIYEEIMKTIWS